MSDTKGAVSTGDETRIEVFGWTDTRIESRRFGTLDAATEAAVGYRFAWIDVEGVAAGDCAAHLERIAPVSPLAADTLIEGVRRAGADDFGDLTIVTMRSHSPNRVVEFVDFLIAPTILATIQEKAGGDPFEPVRERLRAGHPHLLRADTNVVFLLLARTICDGYKPLLTEYNESLEKFERALVRRPDSSMLDRIHEHRRKLLFLRQGLAPLREAIANLQAALVMRAERTPAIAGRVAAMRELQDEVGALLDVVEFQKDSSQHLLDLYLNAASNRLNEIVRVLTIISVIFMPLTLIAGIYGMNFEEMPELRWRLGYPFALGLMLLCAFLLLAFFWHKGWIGDPLRRRRSAASTALNQITELTGVSALGVILSRRKGKSHRAGK